LLLKLQPAPQGLPTTKGTGSTPDEVISSSSNGGCQPRLSSNSLGAAFQTLADAQRYSELKELFLRLDPQVCGLNSVAADQTLAPLGAAVSFSGSFVDVYSLV
jgi:hypothetical protein